MKNTKRKKMIVSIIALILVVAMVLPMLFVGVGGLF